MTNSTAIETQEDLQVRVNESLVELDNLITALKFLKEEAETTETNVTQAVENLLRSNTTLIQNTIFVYLSRHNVVYNSLYGYLQTATGATALNQSVETFFMNSGSFYDRFLKWFKRYQLPTMAEKVRQEVETEINNHLEQFIYASLDSRIEMVLARKKANAAS